MKKIIIIGAGIAGMSAGIYARKNGYEATIYEMHYLPGGMCTAWKRKGFTFEGCMHYIKLTGAFNTHTFYSLWKELGVLPNMKMIRHDVFHTFRDQSGRRLNLYTDADRLEKELLSLSPSDEKEIKALCTAIKRYAWFIKTTGMNPFLLIAKGVGILGGIPLLKKYGAMNIGEYAARFKDPLIRYALTDLFECPDFACTSLFFILAGWHIGGTGYPQGSTLALAKTIERTFLDLNGKIEYRKKVERIIVKDKRAIGIEFDDGTVEKAEIIISAADGHTTLFDMLEDRYTTSAQRERFATKPLYSSFIQVSLGVNRDMSAEPHAVKVQVPVPYEIAGQPRQVLWYHHFAFDSTMAPGGKSSLTVLYPTTLDRWKHLDYQSEEYEAEKNAILDTTVAQLEQVLPGISSQIETSDVATPFTMIRYTNNWKAAPGFMMTKDLAGEMTLNPQYALPGLDNFYMTGQWVKGFGVPMAAMSGKEVIQEICKCEGRKFIAA